MLKETSSALVFRAKKMCQKLQKEEVGLNPLMVVSYTVNIHLHSRLCGLKVALGAQSVSESWLKINMVWNGRLEKPKLVHSTYQSYESSKTTQEGIYVADVILLLWPLLLGEKELYLLLLQQWDRPWGFLWLWWSTRDLLWPVTVQVEDGHIEEDTVLSQSNEDVNAPEPKSFCFSFW